MSKVFLLGVNVSYDKSQQTVVKGQVIKTEKPQHVTTETVTGDFTIVDYSDKALAVFGDTRPIKDRLLAIGGRFNAKLTHEGIKTAGWIFSKTKEQELRNLLTIKNL